MAMTVLGISHLYGRQFDTLIAVDAAVTVLRPNPKRLSAFRI